MTSFQEPLFQPTSTWRPPAVLPQLGSVIALDTETRDPCLKDTGPSFKRGEGEVVGIALADKNTTLYLPIAHQGGDNLDRKLIISYVETVLRNASEVIMANALYDLGWLDTLGLSVSCPVRDIQVAEALLDEERYSYSLDNLSKDYLGKGKKESGLHSAADAYATANSAFDPKSDMWRLPARHVGLYAEADARYTYDIYHLQLPKLHDEDLGRVWELECEVTKVLFSMTKKGVPIDQEAAEKLRDEMVLREQQLLSEFSNTDIWSPPQLGKFLVDRGIKVPKTDKGNYSVTKEFLAHSNEPICQQLNELRGLNRLRKVFIEDICLNGTYKNRIHADYRQTASDEGGTRSGRLASSNPNIQQVPKRSSWGKRIRTLYVAEPDTLWCKADYSSQEPRLQTHYALLENLPKAQEAKQAWLDGKKLYTFFEEVTGLDYDTCKMLCLGIGYGMGKYKMSETLGVSIDECESILERFNRHAPFLRQLFDRTMATASRRGYIRTIMGRRAHFNQWTPGYGEPVFKTKESAQQAANGGRIERAFTSKALNRLIQGSAADQTKLALVECFRAGLDLRMTVHDEISSFVTTEKEAQLQKEIMENVIRLEVPVVSDLDLGPTWC